MWESIEAGLDGQPADAVLGQPDFASRRPGIGRERLFMPGSLAVAGGRLYVGEFKFSTRIVRYTPRPTPR